jgi:hypothetical protein
LFGDRPGSTDRLVYLWLGEITARLHTIIAGLYFSEFAIAGWFGSPNWNKLGGEQWRPDAALPATEVWLIATAQHIIDKTI